MPTPPTCFQPVDSAAHKQASTLQQSRFTWLLALKGYLYPFGKGLCKSAFSICPKRWKCHFKRKLNDRPNRIWPCHDSPKWDEHGDAPVRLRCRNDVRKERRKRLKTGLPKMRLHFISRYCALSMIFSLIYGWIFRYNIAHICTFQQNQIAGIHTFQYYCFCENHTFQYILGIFSVHVKTDIDGIWASGIMLSRFHSGSAWTLHR